MPVLHQCLHRRFDQRFTLHQRDSRTYLNVGNLEFVVEREYNRARPLFHQRLST